MSRPSAHVCWLPVMVKSRSVSVRVPDAKCRAWLSTANLVMTGTVNTLHVWQRATTGCGRLLWCLLVAGVLLVTGSASAFAQWPSLQIPPWDVPQLLSAEPAVEWLRQDQSIHSLLYSGEPYLGAPTQVFAFYASPATLDPSRRGETFPGVVLIHGGGGTAFAVWVELWAQRGYAAIAMDLGGSRPSEPVFDSATGRLNHSAMRKPQITRLPNGGPDQQREQKYDAIGGDHTDDWCFHAVANVVRAHSVLRGRPEVQAERTAVTGISWGGYTTCMVASIDPRFRAAVPVYGCGYLFAGDSVQRTAIDALGDRSADWIAWYDPSSVLSHCRTPILFVNGTNDIHYPLDGLQRSLELVAGPHFARIEVGMKHSHEAGWAPPEIGRFIDGYCLDQPGLAQLGMPEVVGDQVHVSWQAPGASEGLVTLQAAALHFTTGNGRRAEREWESIPAEVIGRDIRVARPPTEANTWFVTATDDRGDMVSTTVQLTDPPLPE